MHPDTHYPARPQHPLPDVVQQYSAFVRLLLGHMTEMEIAAAREEWEFICEQRAWPHPEPFLPAPPCVLPPPA